MFDGGDLRPILLLFIGSSQGPQSRLLCMDPRRGLHTQEVGKQGLCTQFPCLLVANLEVAPDKA